MDAHTVNVLNATECTLKTVKMAHFILFVFYGQNKLHFWRNGINFIEVYLFISFSSVKNSESGKLDYTPKLGFPPLVSSTVIRKRLPSQNSLSQLPASVCGHVTSFTMG